VKLLSKAIDTAFGRSAALAQRLEFAHQSTKAITPADWVEYDQYVDEYLGYGKGQWWLWHATTVRTSLSSGNIFLAHIGKMKPLTENEKKLFEANLGTSPELDAAFTLHARDRVADFCVWNERALSWIP